MRLGARPLHHRVDQATPRSCTTLAEAALGQRQYPEGEPCGSRSTSNSCRWEKGRLNCGWVTQFWGPPCARWECQPHIAPKGAYSLLGDGLNRREKG